MPRENETVSSTKLLLLQCSFQRQRDRGSLDRKGKEDTIINDDFSLCVVRIPLWLGLNCLIWGLGNNRKSHLKCILLRMLCIDEAHTNSMCTSSRIRLPLSLSLSFSLHNQLHSGVYATIHKQRPAPPLSQPHYRSRRLKDSRPTHRT